MCVPFLNETIDAGTYTSYTPGQTQTNLGFVGAFITIQVTAASGSMEAQRGSLMIPQEFPLVLRETPFSLCTQEPVVMVQMKPLPLLFRKPGDFSIK